MFPVIFLLKTARVASGVWRYVFGKGRAEDVGREEREGVGDCGSEV